MARSTHNDPQRQSASEVERALREDRAEVVGSDESLFGPSAVAPETLNIGHAGLRSECWPGTSAPGWGSGRSESAAALHAALRLRRPARKRTPLHRSRPSQAAEARLPQRTMNLHHELSAESDCVLPVPPAMAAP
jgi:hypothetical protein